MSKNFTFRIMDDKQEIMMKECAKYMDVTITDFIRICTEASYIAFKSQLMSADKKSFNDLTEHEKHMVIFASHLFDVRACMNDYEELKELEQNEE